MTTLCRCCELERESELTAIVCEIADRLSAIIESQAKKLELEACREST